MNATLAQLEKNVFRSLNGIVEPALERGLLSSRCLPTTLILMESRGYVSGKIRRTPLFGTRIGSFLVVSTARGRRSFWVKNLQKTPDVTVYLGGCRTSATATVISADGASDSVNELPGLLQGVARAMSAAANRGWAFAILKLA